MKYERQLTKVKINGPLNGVYMGRRKSVYGSDITKIKPSFVKLIQTKKQLELIVSQDTYEIRNLIIHRTPLC